jgi:hypothetical protein
MCEARARASSSARTNGGEQEEDSTPTATPAPAIPNTDTEQDTTIAHGGRQGFTHTALAAVARAIDQQETDSLSRPSMAAILYHRQWQPSLKKLPSRT